MIWGTLVKKFDISGDKHCVVHEDDKLTLFIGNVLPGTPELLHFGKIDINRVREFLDKLNSEFLDRATYTPGVNGSLFYSDDLMKYMVSEQFHIYLIAHGYFNPTCSNPKEISPYYIYHSNIMFKLNRSSRKLHIPDTNYQFEATIWKGNIKIKSADNVFVVFKFIYKMYESFREYHKKPVHAV